MNFPNHCIFYHRNDDSLGKSWNCRAVVDNLEENSRLEITSPKIEIDYKKLELLINSGLSNKQISDEFDVSIATIKRKKKEFNLSSKFSEFKKENIAIVIYMVII